MKQKTNTKVDYKNLLNNLNDVYYRINKDGVLTYINPYVEVLTGYSRKYLIGKTVK